MKFATAYLVFVLMAYSSIAQNKPGILYKDKVFSAVNVQTDLLYNSADSIKTKYREFDFYEPANDSLHKHPLIIWLHGGGFKFGSKDVREIKIWGDEFAKRGYAFAALNYRLSKKHPISKFKDLVSACYDNVDDVQQAIGYFKLNAARFKIDTNKIIIGGNSAGGVIALQSVYSNRADLQNVIDSNKVIANTGNYNPYNIAAVINFWGALFDKDWLSRTNVPIVSVAGAKDKIVPVDTKGVAFFGSVAIHKKANALHITNDIKIYEDYAHELHKHFNPLFYSKATKERHREAAGFAAEFLYDKILK